jgi:LysM repeat protein
MTLSPQWTQMIDGALTEKAWDDYDDAIKAEVRDYKARFGFSTDWKLFKAQIWTESGAPSHAWKTRPMQIGNPGDPGWATIKNQREHSDIISSDSLKKDLKNNRDINDPKFNIQVGMAYVYTKCVTFGTSVSNPTVLQYEVKAGDVIDKIAAAIGTTRQNILDLNPRAAAMIFPKQKLKYQKAAVGVTSCPAFSPELLQKRYNGNRDHEYAAKIQYCLDVIAKIKR